MNDAKPLVVHDEFYEWRSRPWPEKLSKSCDVGAYGAEQLPLFDDEEA